MEKIDLSKLSQEEQDDLFIQLREKRRDERNRQREAYESLKRSFCAEVHNRVDMQHRAVSVFYSWFVKEIEAFREVMAEYGAISPRQMGFTLADDGFKIEVKTSKVKRFDERADLAAIRLVAFLKDWVKSRDQGTDDPMYQLAMLAIERNQRGDLDYKQISNLYKLEGKFNDPDYTAIMELFRESHTEEGTATNFYFYRKSGLGVWSKIEISFNRL